MKNQSHLHTETASPTTTIYNLTSYDMLVFCDGSWDQTYKKTLRFLDRNAGANILYIEKPLAYDPQQNAAKFMMINDHIHVLRPNVASIDEVFKLLPYHIRTKRVPVGWFAAADFRHFSELIRFKSLVDDCNETQPIHVSSTTAQKPAFNTQMTRRNKNHFPVAS